MSSRNPTEKTKRAPTAAKKLQESKSSSESASSLAKGLSELLDSLATILNNETHKNIMCWTNSGRAFNIIDKSKFTKEILPIIFKHQNFPSFVRQMKSFGFKQLRRKEGPSFYLNGFQRSKCIWGRQKTKQELAQQTASGQPGNNRGSSNAANHLEFRPSSNSQSNAGDAHSHELTTGVQSMAGLNGIIGSNLDEYGDENFEEEDDQSELSQNGFKENLQFTNNSYEKIIPANVRALFQRNQECSDDDEDFSKIQKKIDNAGHPFSSINFKNSIGQQHGFEQISKVNHLEKKDGMFLTCQILSNKSKCDFAQGNFNQTSLANLSCENSLEKVSQAHSTQFGYASQPAGDVKASALVTQHVSNKSRESGFLPQSIMQKADLLSPEMSIDRKISTPPRSPKVAHPSQRASLSQFKHRKSQFYQAKVGANMLGSTAQYQSPKLCQSGKLNNNASGCDVSKSSDSDFQKEEEIVLQRGLKRVSINDGIVNHVQKSEAATEGYGQPPGRKLTQQISSSNYSHQHGGNEQSFIIGRSNSQQMNGRLNFGTNSGQLSEAMININSLKCNASAREEATYANRTSELSLQERSSMDNETFSSNNGTSQELCENTHTIEDGQNAFNQNMTEFEGNYEYLKMTTLPAKRIIRPQFTDAPQRHNSFSCAGPQISLNTLSYGGYPINTGPKIQHSLNANTYPLNLSNQSQLLQRKMSHLTDKEEFNAAEQLSSHEAEDDSSQLSSGQYPQKQQHHLVDLDEDWNRAHDGVSGPRSTCLMEEQDHHFDMDIDGMFDQVTLGGAWQNIIPNQYDETLLGYYGSNAAAAAGTDQQQNNQQHFNHVSAPFYQVFSDPVRMLSSAASGQLLSIDFIMGGSS